MTKAFSGKNLRSGLYQAFCILLALLMLFPVLYALSVSFMPAKEILSKNANLLPRTLTLINYEQAFAKTLLPRYMLNSAIVALVSSLSRILIGSMAAYAFAFYEFKGKRLLFSLTLATMMIPVDVLIVSNFITVSKLGWINTYMAVCVVFLVSANNIFLLRQQFLTFSHSLKEAAHIDGCGSLRFFLKILLPVNKSVLTTVFISSFVGVWNQYVWPLLVTNRNEMRTVQVGITMLKDRESSAFGPVMAGVVLALVPTVLVFILFQRKIVAGMMTGAVKE